MSWQWRMIQKLKRNWLVNLKLTRTSQILTGALEKSKRIFVLILILIVTKVYIVWATKVQESYLLWHWGVMQILKKNWLVVRKKTGEFGILLPEHLKVSRLELWWDSFVQSRKDMILKFTEELCVITMKWKIMQNLRRNWLLLSKLTWGI